MALIQNKKAYFDYEIVREYEAGIELFGFEVKSAKKSAGSLKGSHISIKNGEAYLTGARISAYQENNTPESYNPERSRRLLLNKSEINSLSEAGDQKGLTIIPLSVYNKHGKIKVKIAIAKGKKKHDKRQIIKEREEKRKMDRSLKN